jgi:hypothetical protein
LSDHDDGDGVLLDNFEAEPLSLLASVEFVSVGPVDDSNGAASSRQGLKDRLKLHTMCYLFIEMLVNRGPIDDTHMISLRPSSPYNFTHSNRGAQENEMHSTVTQHSDLISNAANKVSIAPEDSSTSNFPASLPQSLTASLSIDPIQAEATVEPYIIHCDYCHASSSYLTDKEPNGIVWYRNLPAGWPLPSSCDVCGRQNLILSDEEMIALINRQDIRQFSCHICHVSYTCLQKVLAHSYHHTGKKAFQCSKCNKRFTRKEKIAIHEKNLCRVRIKGMATNGCEEIVTIIFIGLIRTFWFVAITCRMVLIRCRFSSSC